MTTDGGLRGIFRVKLPHVHWTPIETGLTASGVPDMEGCLRGRQFWVENKLADAYAVGIDSFQIAWHERRARAGGRTFLAVRLTATAGPRKGAARDELFMYRGARIREVYHKGLRVFPLLHLTGGPSDWDWDRVEEVLLTG